MARSFSSAYEIEPMWDAELERKRNAQTRRCASCRSIWRGWITTNKPMPDEALDKRIRKSGWELLGRRAYCPRHASTAKAQKRAIWCKENLSAENKSGDIQEMNMTAEAPRKPSLAENQRIKDALDSHYLTDKGCYTKNFSDETLAATLKVPRAWVTMLRETAYGEHDVSEAKKEGGAKVAELERQLDALTADVLGQLDKIGSELKKIKVAISYAA